MAIKIFTENLHADAGWVCECNVESRKLVQKYMLIGYGLLG